MTQIKDLPDILDEINYGDDYDEGVISQLENDVSNRMPGYTIYTWDADEQGLVEFSEEYTDIITSHLKEGIIDIQIGYWSPDDNSVYVVVVAIKTGSKGE